MSTSTAVAGPPGAPTTTVTAASRPHPPPHSPSGTTACVRRLPRRQLEREDAPLTGERLGEPRPLALDAELADLERGLARFIATVDTSRVRMSPIRRFRRRAPDAPSAMRSVLGPEGRGGSAACTARPPTRAPASAHASLGPQRRTSARRRWHAPGCGRRPVVVRSHPPGRLAGPPSRSGRADDVVEDVGLGFRGHSSRIAAPPGTHNAAPAGSRRERVRRGGAWSWHGPLYSVCPQSLARSGTPRAAPGRRRRTTDDEGDGGDRSDDDGAVVSERERQIALLAGRHDQRELQRRQRGPGSTMAVPGPVTCTASRASGRARR